MLGVVEHERAHVVPRCRERAPLEAAPNMCLSSLDDFVDAEAIRALIAVTEQQRLFVPGRDQRYLALGERDRAAVACFDRSIAAHVIAVAMRVDQARQRLLAEPLGRCEQRQCQRCVAYVARVDQHGFVRAPEQDIVRGQPVADEYVHTLRKDT